jgi:mannitol/fructose-specific phosphotransferase system IIA component
MVTREILVSQLLGNEIVIPFGLGMTNEKTFHTFHS